MIHSHTTVSGLLDTSMKEEDTQSQYHMSEVHA